MNHVIYTKHVIQYIYELVPLVLSLLVLFLAIAIYL